MALKPAHAKITGYFNVDNGTGAIRGVYLQGNEAVAPIFQAWMEPFESLGMTTLTLQNTSGTDHLSFDAVGIPGFQFVQDEVEYETRTHHSNMDVYDRLQTGRHDEERGDRRVVRLRRGQPRPDAAAQAAAEAAAGAEPTPTAAKATELSSGYGLRARRGYRAAHGTSRRDIVSHARSLKLLAHLAHYRT